MTEEEPQWRKLKLKPYQGLADRLKKIRDILEGVREETKAQLEEKLEDDRVGPTE